MLRLRFCLAFFAAFFGTCASSAQTVPAKAHKIKAGKLGHYLKVGAQGTGKFSLGMLEASVDMIGIGIQGVADGVHYLVAVPFESLPLTRPLGLGVDYVYIGIDKVGEYLAK